MRALAVQRPSRPRGVVQRVALVGTGNVLDPQVQRRPEAAGRRVVGRRLLGPRRHRRAHGIVGDEACSGAIGPGRRARPGRRGRRGPSSPGTGWRTAGRTIPTSVPPVDRGGARRTTGSSRRRPSAARGRRGAGPGEGARRRRWSRRPRSRSTPGDQSSGASPAWTNHVGGPVGRPVGMVVGTERGADARPHVVGRRVPRTIGAPVPVGDTPFVTADHRYILSVFVERRLRSVGARLKKLRAELALTEEQLLQMADDAEDSRIRSLVAENRLADHEHQRGRPPRRRPGPPPRRAAGVDRPPRGEAGRAARSVVKPVMNGSDREIERTR